MADHRRRNPPSRGTAWPNAWLWTAFPGRRRRTNHDLIPTMQRAGHAGWALMNAIHDALRRDLDELLRTTASRMAARARWIVFRDQLAAEQAAILGEQADDDGLRAVVAELVAAEPGHRGNRRRGSRSEPATVSRLRSLSQSRDSQDLAGPRRAGGGGAGSARPTHRGRHPGPPARPDPLTARPRPGRHCRAMSRQGTFHR